MSSTLEERLRYAASDCFETFPFPHPDPRTKVPALEGIGRRLYDARAAYLVQTQPGLTQTYNRLKDSDCKDPEIVHLRELHLEMDRAALVAYGWADLIDKPGVPPFTTPQTDADKQALAAFEDAIIDRLFALNAERAAAEAIAGQGTAPAGKPPKKTAKRKDAESLETPKQASLFGREKTRGK